MAGNHNTIKQNPFASIITPLVDAYRFNGEPNPHEVWLAATLIELRTKYWGTNMPLSTELVDPGVGGGGGSTKECCKKKLCSCKTVASAGARVAGGKGAKEPVTTLIQTLHEELRTLDMSQINAWQDWSEAVGYFYNNIGPFLSYFDRNFKGGAYADLYRSAIGVFDHPDSNSKGLSFFLYTKGNAAESITNITSGGLTPDIAPGTEGPYVTVYTDPTNRLIIWWSPNLNGYVQPTVAAEPGVTDTYLPITGTNTDNATKAAQELEGQLGVVPGISVTRDGVVVSITVDYIGTTPTGTYNLTSNGFLAPWSFAFIEGQGGVSDYERIRIDFTSADISLADRFFILYDTAGLSHMFYYDLDAAGTFVSPVVTDTTTAIPILSANDAKDILAATQGVLGGTGLFTLKVTDFLLTVTVTLKGVVNDFDEGTATIGVNYTYADKLIASDTTELATGITNAKEYAIAWNTLRVPHEASLGFQYGYLDPRIISEGSLLKENQPCGACLRAVGIPVWHIDDKGFQQSICQTCGSGTSSSLFRYTTYQMFEIPRYNTPGTILNTGPAGVPREPLPPQEIV